MNIKQEICKDSLLKFSSISNKNNKMLQELDI